MGRITGAATSRGWYAYLDYSIGAQDQVNNTTTIYFTLYVHNGTGKSSNQNTNQAYYQMPGEGIVYQPYSFAAAGDYKIADGGVVVPHNADGTGSYNASAIWCSAVNSSYTPYSLSVSGAIPLPTIPRASTISVGGVATMGEWFGIYVTRAADSFTHTITYQFGEASGTICDKSSDTTVWWTPPLDLGYQIPAATSGTGRLTITTYSGGTAIGTNSIGFTAIMPDAEGTKPTVDSLTAAINPGNVPVSFAGMCIAGYGSITYTASCTARYGATIKRIYGSNGSTGVIQQAGYQYPSAQAQDSRNFLSVAKSLDPIYVWPYAVPTLQFSAWRCKSAEDGTYQQDGNYVYLSVSAGCSPLDGKNTVSTAVYWRAKGGSWTRITAAGSIVGQFADDTVYEFRCDATDTMGKTTSATVTVPSAKVAIHFRDGGNAVGVGMYVQSDGLLEIAHDVTAHKGMTVDGNIGAGNGKVGLFNDSTAKEGGCIWFLDDNTGRHYGLNADANGFLRVYGGDPDWSNFQSFRLLDAGGNTSLNGLTVSERGMTNNGETVFNGSIHPNSTIYMTGSVAERYVPWWDASITGVTNPGIDSFFWCVLLAICNTYPGYSYCDFIGAGSPNAVWFYKVHIYSTDKRSASTGLPQYSGGIAKCGASNEIVTFGTSNYEWFYRVL